MSSESNVAKVFHQPELGQHGLDVGGGELPWLGDTSAICMLSHCKMA